MARGGDMFSRASPNGCKKQSNSIIPVGVDHMEMCNNAEMSNCCAYEEYIIIVQRISVSFETIDNSRQ